MSKRFYLGILALTLLLAGCSKYDDGPVFSLYSPGMRLVGYWYFANVMYGDVDSTSAYSNKQLQFSAYKTKKSGVVQYYNTIYTQTGYFSMMGIWQLIPDTDSLKMVLYKDNTLRDSLVMNWKIKRLAYQDIYLERTLTNSKLLKWSLNRTLW